MKLRTTSVLLCLVSAMSVIACSEKKDAWSAGPPRLEWDKNETVLLLDPPKRSIPSHAKIVFPGDSIAQLNVHSSCKSEFGSGIDETTFHATVTNRNEIEILNVLPDPIWRTFDYSKLGRVICTLKFDLRNHAGSQWKFTAPSFELSALEKLENFKFNNAVPQSFRGDDVEYNLACEHFQNYRKLSDSRDLTSILKELLDGDITNRYGSSDIGNARLKYGSQTCRLSVDQKNADGTRNRLVSQIFEGRFKSPEVHINAKIDFSQSLPLAMQQKATVLEVTIANKSPVDVAYRLFDLVPNNLGIQLVIQRANNVFTIEDEFNVTLHYDIQNAARVISDGDNRVIEIAPFQTGKITATVSTPRLCDEEFAFNNLEWRNGYMNNIGFAYVGYRYAFQNSRFIERILNWDPARRSLVSPTEDAKVLESHVWNKNDKVNLIYPGWAPLNSWITIGKGENPKLGALMFSTKVMCWRQITHQKFPRR